MNIKDIARLAGVSPSTVSKVINGKNESISPKTVEKVLEIVKEYNYIPYSGIRPAKKLRSFLLGVLVTEATNRQELINGILSAAREHRYLVIVCSSNSPKEELKNLSNLLDHQVDGLIWDRLPGSFKQCADLVKNTSTPVEYMCSSQPPGEENIFLDYTHLGHVATQALVEKQHRQILCITDDDSFQNQLFVQGCRQCLFENKIPVSYLTVKQLSTFEKEEMLVPFSATGVICSSIHSAQLVKQEADKTNRHVPKYLSIIALQNGIALSNISSIPLCYEELGKHVCLRLIHIVEGRDVQKEAFSTNAAITSNISIAPPASHYDNKIVVFGTLNVDTVITTSQLPRMGETVRARSRMMMPGGKGINQAIGAARLGSEVYLIGKLGKDYDGSKLFHYLQENDVNTQGIFTTNQADTGQAHIYVEEDGESGIVIHGGANETMTRQEINDQKELFKNAAYCLIQTEMLHDLVLHVATLAKKQGCQVILKPSAVKQLPAELLACVDILIPNEKEINILCPQEPSLEKKAQFFLDKGVGTVIVTLGSKGGYVRNKDVSKYFSAAKYKPLDTTGAADAFCATLAVYLSQNHDLLTSITYANVAAGYSTTHFGSAPSFVVNKSTLEFLVSEQRRMKEDCIL